MKNAIITCTNQRDSDFVCNHWYKSLKDNIDLSNIDVIVLIYELSKKDEERLTDLGMKVFKGGDGGFINNIRFRDYGKYLSECEYDQVLATDGGDIIFQKDISHIFNENKDTFRAVCEEYYLPLKERYVNKGFFRDYDVKKMKKVLLNKQMINSGFICAPKEKFIEMCNEIDNLIVNKSTYGPNQQAVNYILYREGFKRLPEGYNYVIMSSKDEIFIKDGVFYNSNDEKIAVVHNAGHKGFLRSIENFGYGKEFNIPRRRGQVFRSIVKTVTNISRAIPKKQKKSLTE